MKRISFSAVSGLLIMCLGLMVALGWWLHVPNLITVIPGYINMVFNTALCFVFSGAALFLSQNKPKYENWIYILFGTFILVMAGVTLLEYALDLSLGIDDFFIKVWLLDQNPYPGRMAVNTSTAFLLVGISFILFPYSHRKFVALLLQVVIFSVMIFGISALLGYILKLEFLYSWYQYTRMAIHTSVGMTILSVALWSTWSNTVNYSNLYRENEDKKIILLSAMILIGIASISGVAGFIIASNPAGRQLELITIIFLIAISTGLLLLYWQVLPLVRQLIQAKKLAVDSGIELQAIFKHAAEGIITINTNGIIESFNPAATKMFHYYDTEIIGKNIEILIPHHLQEKHRAGMNRYLQTHDSTIVGMHSVEVPGLRKSNEQFPMEISITEMHIDNECKFIGIMHDITERKIAETKILESEARFRLAFDYSPIGMAIVSLKGCWLKVNQSLCDIVGYSESELLRMDFQSITHPDDIEEDIKYAKQLYDGEIPFYQMEKRYIRKDKKHTWILLTGSVIRDELGNPLYYLAQIQDINSKKKAEEELSYKAYYDTVTGLVNRNQLQHSLNLAISSALVQQYEFAVFFIDIDHFKHINDSLGHDVGDYVLRIAGQRLRSNIRKTDIASRFGGDEFILILNGADNPESAAIFADKILAALVEPIQTNEHEIFITASIGISFYPLDGMDYQSLIKNADSALYKAKENGRNNYQFFSAEKLKSD